MAEPGRALVRADHDPGDSPRFVRLGADLKRKIDEFVKHYNQYPKPFMWTAKAESILAKIERLCKGINGARH